MPERDAEVLEVLIGQMAKDAKSMSFSAKRSRVLGHAELFEPVRNLLHRGPHPRINRSRTELLDQGDREFTQDHRVSLLLR